MAGAAQGGGQQDNSNGILWGVAALFATLGAIWYVFKVQIISVYLYIKFYELKLISILGGLLITQERLAMIDGAIRAAIANPDLISFQDMVLLGSDIGAWLRIPFVILMFVLAYVVYSGNTARIFRHIYNMKNLAKLEAKNWPAITPVVDLDLINVDIKKGPWAMALNPMQFCKKYNLLEEVHTERPEALSRRERSKIEAVLKKGEANKIFALQLGPLWQGTDKLPMHTKALFAAFAARINADTDPARKLLMQLAASSMQADLDYTGVDELLKKHENTKLVQEIVTSHAYVMTVMASMLERARDDGVQASADFLWLKVRDRRLWYILNTVGRQTPFIEVAGIFSHWIAEKEAARKLLVPMVDAATTAVELALKDIVYKRDEQAS